MPIASILPAI